MTINLMELAVTEEAILLVEEDLVVVARQEAGKQS